MKSILRKEVIIGLIVIVAMLILFFGINFLKGVNLFKASNYYYAVYGNVEGLAQSAPVTINGFKVGIVRDIKYDYSNPGHVIVEMSVDKSLRVPVGSEAVLASDLLGTASIALKLVPAGAGFHNVGDTLVSKVNAGMMANISDNLMPAVNAMIPKLDSLFTSLNAIAANPALHQSINRLDDITAELNGTLRALRAATASLGPITTDIKSITGNVDTMTGDLAVVSGRLREAPIDSIAVDLSATMANLKQLTESLNNPDGSVGKLTSDPALYDNLNATITSLDSLFVDIKRNPKRYISIKVF
jgi:phospholipid/cholesterol/gamma-HCH transport system substrate-binding protein